MEYSRRRLPHWYVPQKPLFLTWNLAGSLPRDRFPPPTGLNAGRAFVWMDRYLHEAHSGPAWLSRPEIASMVQDALHYRQHTLHHYDLHAYVIMPNHVHLLTTANVPVPELLRSLKTFTARQANEFLSRRGEPFWQKESYDHWVRDDHQFHRIKAYIEQNPVEAGLVSRASEFEWSSLYRAAGG